MHEILQVSARTSQLRLHNTFETAKGRKDSSPAVIIEILLDGGVRGLGSATPVEYVTGETPSSVLLAVEKAGSVLHGKSAEDYDGLFKALSKALPADHSARAGLEIALLDAHCRLKNTSMWQFFGGALSRVETDLTIPIVSPTKAAMLASEAAAQGFRYLKVKVGGPDAEEDLARVQAISTGAPGVAIRLDANQGFSADGAVEFVARLQEAGVNVDILEQPVDRNDLQALKYVTDQTSVPVFADEAAVTPSDVRRLLEMDAVDGVNVKLMKSGISGALEIIEMCREAGKQLMLGCMVESGIGLAAAVHLACGTGAFSRHDLDAHLLIADDPYTGGFEADGPWLFPAASS